jgi:hypothetical protein
MKVACNVQVVARLRPGDQQLPGKPKLPVKGQFGHFRVDAILDEDASQAQTYGTILPVISGFLQVQLHGHRCDVVATVPCQANTPTLRAGGGRRRHSLWSTPYGQDVHPGGGVPSAQRVVGRCICCTARCQRAIPPARLCTPSGTCRAWAARTATALAWCCVP